MERSNVYAQYTTLNALPEIWPIVAQRCGSDVALQDAYSTPAVTLTFAQMSQQINQFAAALQSLGVQQGDRISSMR
jgi:long-chain acyl-CoA synthetase